MMQFLCWNIKVKSFSRLLKETRILESFSPAIIDSNKGTVFLSIAFPKPFYPSSHPVIPSTTGPLVMHMAQNADQQHRHSDNISFTVSNNKPLQQASIAYSILQTEHSKGNAVPSHCRF